MPSINLKFDPYLAIGIFLSSVCMFFALKIIFYKVFNIKGYKNDLKRKRELESLKSTGVQSVSIETKYKNKLERWIDEKFGEKKNENFERDIKLLDWGEKYPTINSWYAYRLFYFLICGAIGLVPAILFHPILIVPFLLYGYFTPKNQMKRTASAVKSRLLEGFPDFLRITQGYLASGFTFQESLKNSIPFLTKQWKRFVEDLVIDMQLSDPITALNNLREKVDLVDIREFVAITTLVLEQGGDAKTAFDSMVTNIDSMLKDIMDKKIESRKHKAQAIQPLLMILMLATFVLPFIPKFREMQSMMGGMGM